MKCKRNWHLRCRADGQALWKKRHEAFYRYWACSRDSCRTEVERLKAMAMAESEAIDVIDSDSDEIQITGEKAPPHMLQIGVGQDVALPSNLDEEELYGSTSSLPRQSQTTSLSRNHNPGSRSRSTLASHLYTYLPHDHGSTQAHTAPRINPTQPEAGPSSSRPDQILMKAPTAFLDEEPIAEVIPGLVGRDAPPHVISSDSDSDNDVPLSDTLSLRGSDQNIRTHIDNRQTIGSWESPRSERPAFLSHARQPAPPPSSTHGTSLPPPQPPHHVTFQRSPPPPLPRPLRRRSFRDQAIAPRRSIPHPRTPPSPTPMNPPTPSPSPTTRTRSPTPLDTSIKEALIRAHQDGIRSKTRSGPPGPLGIGNANTLPDADVEMDDHASNRAPPKPATPATSRVTEQHPARQPPMSDAHDRMLNYRSMLEDDSSSSDGELGAWARHPYDGGRPSGGAFSLAQLYRDDTLPRQNARQSLPRGRGGRSNLFTPPVARTRGTGVGRGTGVRGPPPQARASRDTDRGPAVAGIKRRRLPSPVAGPSRALSPPDDLTDSEEEDRAPRRPRPRPVKRRAAPNAIEDEPKEDDMQSDTLTPSLDNLNLYTSHYPSDSPSSAEVSDGGHDRNGKKPANSPGGRSRDTFSTSFSSLNLNSTPRRPHVFSAKRMSAVLPPPTPKTSSKRKHSPLRTRTFEEIRTKIMPGRLPKWEQLPLGAPQEYKDARDLEEEFLPTIVRCHDRMLRWKAYDEKLAQKEEMRREREERRREREERRREKEKRRWDRT
ncbi:unnamed protein product [Peniophora sp. CBMAI 1063]|nr:unnamed protein product [Peniophora sp. CBMAI 1063]